MAKQPHKRLVVLLERCDAVAPVASVKANPHLSRSPRVELVDCLSFPKSPDRLVKVRKKSCKAKKRNKTGKMAEAIAACVGELRCESEDIQCADQSEELHETSVPKSCSAVVEMDVPPLLTFEDDQPPDSAEVDGKVEAPERVCAPERLSIFDQMPLLILENDDFFPAPEDPLLADSASLMLCSGEALVGSGEVLVEIGSRNSSLLSEYPAAELILELNNDVMLGDVGNRSMLLEEEELLVPGAAITMETVAGENIEFGQNDFAIDAEMDWSCDQTWPLLEPGASLPEGHGLLNSSLEAGDSDDEFGQRMREEFLARRLRCSTRLQNQQRLSAERSLSESDNLDSDSKIVIRKRSRDVPNTDVQDEFVQKKSKMRRIHSKSNDKVLVPVEPTATQDKPVDGKTDTAEFLMASVSDDVDGENLKETDRLRQKKANKRDRPSTEMKAKTVQATNSLLMSRNETENSQERKNSFGKSVQSSDDGKSLRKSVDVPAEEVLSAKKPSSRAKENKVAPEKVTANDVKLSKSLMNSVEAAKQKYLLMKKEREAIEPKELSAEEKAKKAKDGCVKNPCREPGCSASARPDSIFCSSECLSRHVEESIKLLAQDRHKTYNRSQQPGISGISDAAKATERIVVFERKTGKLVTGPLAPTELSLLSWLQRHPTFEVLQPEQALGHVSGNLKKKKKLEHGGRRYGTEPNTVSRANLSGAPSDKTQKNSGAETKLGLSGKSAAAANARSDSASNDASHSNEKMESAEHLDPLRSNTRSELRHLLLERFDRDVSVARVKRLVVEIECELWSASRGSTSSYKQKFSGLVRIFKRPSSQDLCRRLLCAELKPRQLLQQTRELQRSETAIRSDTKNTMVSPLDLLPGLIDTTDRHGEHIFDVSCRICSGRSTRTIDSEHLQPLTSSDTTSSNKMSTCIDEKTLKPEVSSHLEKDKGIEGDSSGSSEANGTDAVLERKTVDDEFVGTQEMEGSSGETVMSDAVVCTTSSPAVSSCVDSKRSDEGQSSVVTCNEDLTTSPNFPPSTVQSTTSVPSPEIPLGHLSSDASSSSISPVILSPTATTSGVSTGQLSIPVQKLSCKSSSGHSSLDLRPSNIPSGYSSDVPAPSVEISACPAPPSSADLIANVDQVPFVSSPASAQTSAPCSSLSTNTSSSVTVSMRHSSVEMSVETRLSSVQMQTHDAVRHSSAEMLLPSRHSATDVRPALEGSTSATMSRPQGSSRANSTSSSGHDTLIDLVWKGSVSALDGATMQLCAYRTSGSMKIVRSVLPSTVTVMGRIDPKTVEDYLQKIRQQYTATREIAVICFHCHDDAEKPKYNQLFNYLQDRRRCGVIGSIDSTIKDMYIWPLPARAPIPAVLLPFNGPGLDVNRFDVLLGIVIQQARSRGCVPKQPTSNTSLHSNVVAAQSKARVSVDSAPTAQDNHAPTSAEIKNENETSPANDESSDEVSDDDLKAIAQADPIVSKYSKARPQELLVQARNEGDKPYDPFDEDYEIGSAAENPLKPEADPVLNGHQKLTESIDHGEDVSPKPCVQRKTSEIHQHDDQQSCDSLAKDTAQGAEESRLRSDGDSKTLKPNTDTVVSKQHQRSDKSVNGSESSTDAQNTGSLDVRVHECVKGEANQDVVLIGESSKETKSPGMSKDLSCMSKESQRRSVKASTVVSSETGDAKPSAGVSCTKKKSETKRGGVTTDGGSAAVKTAAGQETTVQSTEAGNLDSSSPETLTNIATILTQLSEKNALNQDILRSLLDQLLSVYGAQNDRDQRAILIQLVETIEKQHSVAEKQESMTESQQSVTEQQQSVAKNETGVAEMQQSLMKGQQSVAKKQQSMTVDQQSMTESQQNVAKLQTGKSMAAGAVPNGGAQMKAAVEKRKSEVLETCHQPTGIESQVVDDESKRMGDQFNIRFMKGHGLDSRREIAQSRFYDEQSDTYQVTPEEWHMDFGKPLVQPGERGPWNFQKHFPAEHGRTEDSAESSPAKDVIHVPALGSKGVESQKDGFGKAALGLVGPKANKVQNISPRFGLICPEFNQGQHGMTIARSEANIGREEVVRKAKLMEDSCVSSRSRHLQTSGNMSSGEETFNSKDSVAENNSVFRKGDNSLAESDYPAIYQTDIQSRFVKDKPTQPASCEGYDTGWFSPPHGWEPVHSVWNSEKRPQGLDPDSQVPVEGSSLHSTMLPRQTGELRSCLKKRKPETSIEEPGINIEKILPVLSDSSFETLKSIVMSAKSVGIVPPRDPEMERRSQGHAEDQHRPMTAQNSLDVLTNAAFWSSPSFTQPLASPPFPGHHSPERPLLSPTFSNTGRLPAPPKPPPSLLQGTRIQAFVPEAFSDSQLPKTWMQTCPPHPGFQSPTIYEQVNPCRKISPSGGNARLTFSPPWRCGEPAYPAGHSRWSGSALEVGGCLPGRSSSETAMEDWSYPYENPRLRSLATETQQFWQSNNYDTATLMRSQNSHEQSMAPERAKGMAVSREDFSGKEMIERNFGHCHNKRPHFPDMETEPTRPSFLSDQDYRQQTEPTRPSFLSDQDYRQPFCDSGTKSLFDSTYNDREFPENSYEFFGSIPKDGSSFESLGELLPGLGALETTDFPERTVDLFGCPSSQIDGNERIAGFEYDQSNESSKKVETAVKTEIDQLLAPGSAKTDTPAKTETADKSEIATAIGCDLKAGLADHSELNIEDDVCVKPELVAYSSTEMTSRTESSAQSEMMTKTSLSRFDCETASGSNEDVDRETKCDQALSETSGKTVFCSSEGIDKETASELDIHNADKEDELSEALASFSALIEHCTKTEFDTSSTMPDEAQLINDVSKLVKRCLDSDLLSYSEICGRLGLSSLVFDEKGTLVDDEQLPHVKKSCSESLGANREMRSHLLSKRCDSPKIQRDVNVEDLNRSKDPKPHELGSDSNTATHINESGDCVIGCIDKSSDDSKMQWDVPCSGDPLQTVVDGHNAVTKSTPDMDGSRVRSKAHQEPRVSVKHHSRASDDKSRLRTDSCDSGDSVTNERRRDSRSRSNRQARDSYSSCDSPEKRRHRHDSCNSSEKRRYYRSSPSKQSHRHNSSESGNYPGHRESTAKRRRSHDSRGRSKKHSRHSHDTEEDCEDLLLSSDEPEKRDRTRDRGTTINSRGGSYQSSESDNQRFRKEAVTSLIGVDDKHFMGRRSDRDTRLGMRNNRSHRDRKRDVVRQDRTRSPSECSDLTATSGERRRDFSERTSGNRSANIDERTFRKFWKEEEHFNDEVGKRSQRRHISSQDRNDDREERRRRTERTHDSRSEKRHKEDVFESKPSDAKTVGLAAFAGFISRRIPLEVENEVPWSKDQTHFVDALHGAIENKNLIIDVSSDKSRVVGDSMGVDWKIGPSVSQDCGAGIRRHQHKQSDHVGNLVADAIAKSLPVSSTSERQKSLCNRDGKSSEFRQSICTELVHANGGDGTSNGQETADHSTGHLVVGGQQAPGGQLLPNGQPTQMVPNLRNASNSEPAENLHRQQQNNDPVSELWKTRPSPKKQPVKVATDEELEDGEIVDAPDEWPSATRELLALLNAPKSWVSPAPAITRFARHQPGPSKT